MYHKPVTGPQNHTSFLVVGWYERGLPDPSCGEVLMKLQCFSSFLYFRIAAISMASKITDMQLGDSVEISKLITKKEVQQAR